jgi:tRNA-Thr(GGU) m(6)t(6)A37 methyltransferase TsaA
MVGPLWLLNRLQFGRRVTMDSLDAVTLHPIGVVRSRVTDLRHRATPGERATIELGEQYLAALTGLDGFSHAIVLTWLDRVSEAERAIRQEHPAGDRALPLTGVLALRTHHRPNPIGLTVVAIEWVEGARVAVRGLDVIDGTPVLDIKPYIAFYDSVPHARLPNWAGSDQRGVRNEE